jgi:peptide-methionine (S)-S-oxide reductase
MFTIQKNYKAPLATELLPATEFWLAEDYHQQYLEKGGQIAKKLATEQIRCYG